MQLSGLSVFRLSRLRQGDMGEGELTLVGEIGETPFGVCEPECESALRVPALSDSFASGTFRGLAPRRWFFCLNFSSQLLLFTFAWLSELPTVVAKKRALSRMILSLKGKPCRWWFRAQFDNARSISGNFPFDLLIGDLLPSSAHRYLSFCRNTFETVLQNLLVWMV